MRTLLFVLTFVVVSLCARAQGLVQLTFDGEVETTGGANVQTELTFVDPQSGRPHTFTLAVLIGERTSALDLAGLLARRLDQAGARVTFTGSMAPMRGPVTLFVEDVTAVGLRLGFGLSATVTLCEDRPASIKLTPGLELLRGARILVAAHTIEQHSRQPGKVLIDLELDDKSDATDTGTRMVKQAIDKDWFSELEGHEVWRPGPTAGGGTVVSCSLRLQANADWRLDVSLAPRATQR